MQWKNPALSALVLLLGSFCALAGEFILRGSHNVTPLKGEACLAACLPQHMCSAFLLCLQPMTFERYTINAVLTSTELPLETHKQHLDNS